jgi:hypothetical protein
MPPARRLLGCLTALLTRRFGPRQRQSRCNFEQGMIGPVAIFNHIVEGRRSRGRPYRNGLRKRLAIRPMLTGEIGLRLNIAPERLFRVANSSGPIMGATHGGTVPCAGGSETMDGEGPRRIPVRTAARASTPAHIGETLQRLASLQRVVSPTCGPERPRRPSPALV